MKTKLKAIILSAFLVGIAHTTHASYSVPDYAARTIKTDLSQHKFSYTPDDTYRNSAFADYNIDQPSNLYNLDHYKAYTWGFDLGIDLTKVKIDSAEIKFSNIRNWDNNDFTLTGHLLDVVTNTDTGQVVPYKVGTKKDRQYVYPYGNQTVYTDALGVEAGVTVVDEDDRQREGDFFRNVSPDVGRKLFKEEKGGNIRTRSQANNSAYDYMADFIYRFDEYDIADLMTFAADGLVGLGFDPDCHFWNDGITFTITTSSLPGGDAVPEPTTMLLFGTGLIGIAGMRRRRMKK